MAIPDESKPLHIAIIGGGIGGVILGVALSKYPHITFTIYESRGAFGEIGAGIEFPMLTDPLTTHGDVP